MYARREWSSFGEWWPAISHQVRMLTESSPALESSLSLRIRRSSVATDFTNVVGESRGSPVQLWSPFSHRRTWGKDFCLCSWPFVRGWQEISAKGVRLLSSSIKSHQSGSALARFFIPVGTNQPKMSMSLFYVKSGKIIPNPSFEFFIEDHLFLLFMIGWLNQNPLFDLLSYSWVESILELRLMVTKHAWWFDVW